MVSYSTGTSGTGSDVDKVREATEIGRRSVVRTCRWPGPIQYDAAVDEGVGAAKLPGQSGGRPRDGDDLPGPEHGQHHLQGRAEVGAGRRDRTGAAGPAQAGQRPVAGLHRFPTSSTRSPSRPIQAQQVAVVTEVLVINTGSSSLKYQLVDSETEQWLAKGLVERIGEGGSRLRARGAGGEPRRDHRRPCRSCGAHSNWCSHVRRRRAQPRRPRRRRAPGRARRHRTIASPSSSTRRSRRPIEGLDTARAAAQSGRPARHPRAAAPHAGRAAASRCSTRPSTPPCRRRHTRTRSPTTWPQQHRIRKYGFHGTSYRYVTRKAAEFLGVPVDEVNLIICHLGNGASMAAVRGGRQRRHHHGADAAAGAGHGYPVR